MKLFRAIGATVTIALGALQVADGIRELRAALRADDGAGISGADGDDQAADVDTELAQLAEQGSPDGTT